MTRPVVSVLHLNSNIYCHNGLPRKGRDSCGTFLFSHSHRQDKGMGHGCCVVARHSFQIDSEAMFLGSLIPESMPRLIDRPVELPPQLPQNLGGGFDVNSIDKIIFPDLDIDRVYTGALLVSFVVFFVSFEGLELLREYNSEKEYEELAEQKDKGKKDVVLQKNKIEHMDVVAQRRRGLGWLALVTFIAVWSTGVLNSPNPLQP